MNHFQLLEHGLVVVNDRSSGSWRKYDMKTGVTSWTCGGTFGNFSMVDLDGCARQAAEVIEAEGHARATEILAGAEAERVATLDAAMAKACATSQQRELVLAAGDVIKNSGATVLMGASPALSS